MFRIRDESTAVEFEFSSELCLLDRVLERCEAFLRRYDIHESSEFTLVLRELVSNAIIHGNERQAARVVRCRVEQTDPSSFKITVEDEGEGFDPGNVNMTPPEDPREIPGRGYILIHAFSDKVEFNERGNRISAHVVLTPRNTADEVKEVALGVPVGRTVFEYNLGGPSI